MKFHVLTLFPDMVMQGLMTSITGRAVQQKKIDIDAVNIRDYTQDKHGRVDDYPYGGGAGMLMQAQPVALPRFICPGYTLILCCGCGCAGEGT